MNSTTTANLPQQDLDLIEKFKVKAKFYYDAKELLDLTIGFILVVMSLVGNCFIVYLMQSKNLSKLTVSIYLTCLAISDSLVLISGNFIIWLDLIMQDFSIQQATHCKIYFPYFIFKLVSSWIVVSISLDRFLSVYYPQTTRKFRGKKSCILRVVLFFIFATALNLYYPILIDSPDQLEYDCRVPNEGKNKLWYEEIYPIIQTVIYSILPSLLLFVFNSLIIYKTKQSKNNLKKLTVNPTPTNTTTMTTGVHRIKLTPAAATVTKLKQADRSNSNNKKMNLTMSIICVSFMLFTLPASAFNIYATSKLTSSDDYAYEFAPDGKDELKYHTERVELFYLLFVRRILEHVMYINHSINFVLYILTSNLFRNELMFMLKNKFRNNNKVKSTVVAPLEETCIE